MTSISERRQHLDFDTTWEAVKWDESDEFIGSMDKTLHNLASASPVKAADAVAVRRAARVSPVVLVAEFKDFDFPNIPAEHRAQAARGANTEELMAALIRKVIDTLAGASFSHDSSDVRSAELQALTATLSDPNMKILVLFCIEVPRTQAVAVLPWTKKLQQRLRWLGPNAEVIVTTSARPFIGSGVTYRV